MGLGGNAFGVLTYYLLSPFNLLVVFFLEESVSSLCYADDFTQNLVHWSYNVYLSCSCADFATVP